MSDYDFELPWPPSVNGYWRSFRGRQILSKPAREYIAAVSQAMEERNLCNERTTDRLVVVITLHPPTARKYDIDNRTKAVFDCLSKCGFWLDDEQVDVLTVRKGDKVPGGNVVVKVSKLGA